jgi:predicted protein tyrosine phosphatase
MNNVKTTGSSKLKRPRKVFTTFLAVAIPVGFYLYFFVINANFREVITQKVYRSAQPSPTQLRKWVSRYGIRTVINLRGNAGKITAQEQAVANELGVKIINIRHFKSSSLPTKDTLAKLIQAIETAEQPILIHCHAGVDRSGTASALAAMAIGKESYDTAKWQAYVPPGPWKRERKNKYVHISDMLKLYEKHRQSNKPNTSDWLDFKQWTATTDAFGDMDTKYRHDFTLFSQFNKTKWFYQVAKLIRGAWIQFTSELGILSLLAAVIYRKLPRN